MFPMLFFIFLPFIHANGHCCSAQYQEIPTTIIPYGLWAMLNGFILFIPNNNAKLSSSGVGGAFQFWFRGRLIVFKLCHWSLIT